MFIWSRDRKESNGITHQVEREGRAISSVLDEDA